MGTAKNLMAFSSPHKKANEDIGTPIQKVKQ